VTDHPRPLLVRPHWQDLSGPWGFATDDVTDALVPGAEQVVVVRAADGPGQPRPAPAEAIDAARRAARQAH
jgi:hypothetical protein